MMDCIYKLRWHIIIPAHYQHELGTGSAKDMREPLFALSFGLLVLFIFITSQRTKLDLTCVPYMNIVPYFYLCGTLQWQRLTNNKKKLKSQFDFERFRSIFARHKRLNTMNKFTAYAVVILHTNLPFCEIDRIGMGA